nr:cell division control protein 45 [Cryptomonas curvata]
MIINLTKHNLINNINFQIEQIKKENEVKIIIFLKINLDSLLISKMLIALFNSNFISCELLIVMHQSEINYFLKKNELRNYYFLFFFINFGGNIYLKKFYYKNSYFLKKIFVIDFCQWFYTYNLFSSAIVVIVDRQTFDYKYFKFLNNFILKWKENFSLFFSNDLFKDIQKPNFYFYNNIWLEVIHVSSMCFLGTIDLEKYNKFIFYIGKKFDFYFKKTNNLMNKNFFQRKIKLNFLRKTNDLSIFLLRHSSLLCALTNTPSFSLKFRLWKYSGILKLSQLFFKLGISFIQTKQPWVKLKRKIKQNFKKKIFYYAKNFGVKLIKICSFEKLFNSIKTYGILKLHKISNIDFFYAVKSIFFMMNYRKLNLTENSNYLKMYNCFLSFKIIKYAIKTAKESQDFVNRISRIIITKKTYLNEVFFRYSFLQNSRNINLNYDTLKNLSFYLMLAFYQKFKKKKAFFLVMRTEELSIITGSFFNNKECKKLKEKLKKNTTLSIKTIDFPNSKTLTLILKTNNEINLFKNIIKFLKCK